MKIRLKNDDLTKILQKLQKISEFFKLIFIEILSLERCKSA